MVTKALPDGWDRKRVGEIADVVGGTTPSRTRPEYYGGEIPWVTPTDVTGLKGRSLRETREMISQAGLRAAGLRELPAGSLLVTSRATIGSLAIAAVPVTTNQGFQSLVPKDGIDPLWLYYAIQAQRTNLERLASGSTFKEFSRQSLRSLVLLVPPPHERTKITTVLDSIDDTIEKAEAVVEATGQLRQILLHDLLTRGVPGWHSEWKQVPEMGTVPTCWRIESLGNVADVERGKFSHRPRNEPRFYGGPYPFVQTGDVANSDGRLRSYSQTLNEDGLAISRLFPRGTIVMTIAANIGSTAIAEFNVAFPDSLVGIMPQQIQGKFLEYYLRTRKQHLNELAPESAQKNINLETLRPLPVPVPSPQEQVKIESVLQSVEDYGWGQRLYLSQLRESQAMVRDALLSGRVRVSSKLMEPIA